MIKEIRMYHGLTQLMLAQILDVDITTVRKWEYSLRNPNEENIKKLKENKLWM